MALALMAAGCTEDYSEKGLTVDAPMAPVQNLEAESFVSAVILSWDLPADEQYYYSTIKYKDSEGNSVIKKVSRFSLDPENNGRIRAVIGGFTDTQEHEFTVTACSYHGNESESVKVSGTPQDRSKAKDFLVKTVKFEPLSEAVNITWENELDADLSLVVEHLDYYNTSGKVETLTTTYGAKIPKVETISNLPVETDIKMQYYMIDNETGEQSEKMEATFQVLPNQYDTLADGVLLFPVDYYGINMMDITWNESKNEFKVVTSGTDPYLYTKLSGTPTGTKIVFRYRSVQNITNFEIFLNGRAPGAANEVVYKAPDGYNGLRRTNGYWKTVVWDLSDAQKNKFDFINNSATNQNRIRIDFGSQNKRTLEFRNMHWE